MVTTRSQDKMTFADKIRAKGFSLADCKFVKLNALFPIMLGLAQELGFPGSGWIERVQSAQYNTWESAILAVCCFFVGIEEKLTPSLFSELAALLLVCRLVYPLPYALDVDLVRTQVWLTGLYVAVRAEIKSMLAE